MTDEREVLGIIIEKCAREPKETSKAAVRDSSQAAVQSLLRGEIGSYARGDWVIMGLLMWSVLWMVSLWNWGLLVDDSIYLLQRVNKGRETINHRSHGCSRGLSTV